MNTPPSTGKKRILFVDCQVSFTRLAIRVLMQNHPELEGHAVNDALTALETVRQFKPDMIFLNLDMGELTGYDVATQIKEDPVSNALPIQFVSNSIPRDSELTPNILYKPTSIDHLVECIREHLGP